MLVQKYVDGNNSAAMLATKRSVGVAQEVNLGILLHAAVKAYKQGAPGKPRADVTRSLK